MTRNLDFDWSAIDELVAIMSSAYDVGRTVHEKYLVVDTRNGRT